MNADITWEDEVREYVFESGSWYARARCNEWNVDNSDFKMQGSSTVAESSRSEAVVKARLAAEQCVERMAKLLGIEPPQISWTVGAVNRCVARLGDNWEAEIVPTDERLKTARFRWIVRPRVGSPDIALGLTAVGINEKLSDAREQAGAMLARLAKNA